MSLVRLRDAEIIIDPEDTSTTVFVGEGELNWDEKRPIEYAPLRGVFEDGDAGIDEGDTIRTQDEEPMDVSFSFVLRNPESGTNLLAAADAIKGSTTGCGAPYVDFNVILDSCPASASIGDSTDNYTYSFHHFRWESLNYDFNSSRCSCSGKCQYPNMRKMNYDNP